MLGDGHQLHGVVAVALDDGENLFGEFAVALFLQYLSAIGKTGDHQPCSTADYVVFPGFPFPVDVPYKR